MSVGKWNSVIWQRLARLGDEWPFRQSDQGRLLWGSVVKLLVGWWECKDSGERNWQVRGPLEKANNWWVQATERRPGACRVASKGWVVCGEEGERNRRKEFIFTLSVMRRSHLEFLSREWSNLFSILRNHPGCHVESRLEVRQSLGIS